MKETKTILDLKFRVLVRYRAGDRKQNLNIK